jgi:hypothetical protein
MIDFLRRRYDSYNANQRGDERFFRVNVFSYHGNVGLYFEKKNLYLRGWEIKTDSAEFAFMAAWDDGEWNKVAQGDNSPIASLPYQGKGYEGPKKGGYIKLQYSNNEPNVNISKSEFFRLVGELHIFLSNKSWGDDAKLANAQTSFHRLAKMTSEMARFGRYCDHFAARWIQDTALDMSPRPKDPEDWEPAKQMPPFLAIIKEWKSCTDAYNGKSFKLTWTASGAGAASNVIIDQNMAKEILGAGARWVDRGR